MTDVFQRMMMNIASKSEGQRFEPTPSRAPKILLIEHELGLLEPLSILLERSGYRVQTAWSGRDGIGELREDLPDMVVCEVKTPDLTGIDVLRTVRELDPSLPVILIAARAEIDMAIQALNQGAVQYIEKPFVNRALLTRVEDALQSRGGLPAEPRDPGRLATVAPPAIPTMEMIEKAYTEHVLEMTEKNKARLAEILGIGTGPPSMMSTVLYLVFWVILLGAVCWIGSR